MNSSVNVGSTLTQGNLVERKFKLQVSEPSLDRPSMSKGVDPKAGCESGGWGFGVVQILALCHI